jgi:hypothetical protein
VLDQPGGRLARAVERFVSSHPQDKEVKRTYAATFEQRYAPTFVPNPAASLHQPTHAELKAKDETISILKKQLEQRMSRYANS